MMKLIWSDITRLFASIPIIGGLIHCSLADHRAAMRDFLYAITFSTITFWMSAIVLMAYTANKDKSYLSLLISTISNGELFIFSVGFLGPALLLTIDDPIGAKQFPGKVWHALAFIIIGCIAAAFFALIKTTSTPGMPALLNHEFLFFISVFLAVCCCVLRYLSIVYRKFTLRPDDLIKEKEKDFSNEFARRHGGIQQ